MAGRIGKERARQGGPGWRDAGVPISVRDSQGCRREAFFCPSSASPPLSRPCKTLGQEGTFLRLGGYREMLR